MKEDMRTVAKKWVEVSLAPNSRIALEEPFFMPRLNFSLGQLQEKYQGIPTLNHFSKGEERRIQFLISEQSRGKIGYELHYLTDDTNASHFLFSQPKISYNFEGLKKEGIEYVLIARLKENHAQTEFYRVLQREAELVKRFSPYRDGREYPYDKQAQTGGPFLWRELWGRERNGQPIEIYRLK